MRTEFFRLLSISLAPLILSGSPADAGQLAVGGRGEMRALQGAKSVEQRVRDLEAAVAPLKAQVGWLVARLKLQVARYTHHVHKLPYNRASASNLKNEAFKSMLIPFMMPSRPVTTTDPPASPRPEPPPARRPSRPKMALVGKVLLAPGRTTTTEGRLRALEGLVAKLKGQVGWLVARLKVQVARYTHHVHNLPYSRASASNFRNQAFRSMVIPFMMPQKPITATAAPNPQK